MLIVIDSRAPEKAKLRLSNFGEVVEFSTQNITYEAISGHPDIFLCQTPDSLICAPNLPPSYFKLFKDKNIDFLIGANPVGKLFPETSHYNCLVNERFIFHKSTYTDARIIELNKVQEFINLPQAYTRCSLIELPSKKFITSDKGIENVLKNRKLNVYYFPPNEILLPTMPHGFIGGAMGFYSGKLFVLGNPDYYTWGKEFNALMKQENIELISLYDGPFFDGGGIFFLESKK